MQFDLIQSVDNRQNIQIRFYAIFGWIDKYIFFSCFTFLVAIITQKENG